MSRTSQGHEFYITLFSPEGRLYQVGIIRLTNQNMHSRLSKLAALLRLLSEEQTLFAWLPKSVCLTNSLTRNLSQTYTRSLTKSALWRPGFLLTAALWSPGCATKLVSGACKMVPRFFMQVTTALLTYYASVWPTSLKDTHRSSKCGHSEPRSSSALSTMSSDQCSSNLTPLATTVATKQLQAALRSRSLSIIWKSNSRRRTQPSSTTLKPSSWQSRPSKM